MATWQSRCRDCREAIRSLRVCVGMKAGFVSKQRRCRSRLRGVCRAHQGTQALGAACRSLCKHASPAQKFQADLEGKGGDLVPPLARWPRAKRHLGSSDLATEELVSVRWCGLCALNRDSVCVFGGCTHSPLGMLHPSVGGIEGLQSEQRAQTQRPPPPARGYRADNHKPPESMRVNLSGNFAVKLSPLPLCGLNTVLGSLLALAGTLARVHALAAPGLRAALPPQQAAGGSAVHTKAPRPLEQPAEASASYASPAQKFQADLE